MAKIVRYEFLGNWFYLCLLCIFLLPIGVVYWLVHSLRIEEEPDAGRFCHTLSRGQTGPKAAGMSANIAGCRRLNPNLLMLEFHYP